MNDRMHLAGMALQGILGATDEHGFPLLSYKNAAQYAVAHADALLAELAKNSPPRAAAVEPVRSTGDGSAVAGEEPARPNGRKYTAAVWVLDERSGRHHLAYQPSVHEIATAAGYETLCALPVPRTSAKRAEPDAAGQVCFECLMLDHPLVHVFDQRTPAAQGAKKARAIIEQLEGDRA